MTQSCPEPGAETTAAPTDAPRESPTVLLRNEDDADHALDVRVAGDDAILAEGCHTVAGDSQRAIAATTADVGLIRVELRADPFVHHSLFAPVEDRGDLRLALEDVMAMTPRPDAIHCSNDIVASGVLLAASRQGIRIPEELAVGGYLGLPLAEHLTPKLTTLAVARSEMGTQAAELLLERLSGKTPEQPIRDLGFTLVKGGST